MVFWFNALAILGAFVTGGLHLYGIAHGLYWLYPWDVVVHLFAGLTFGLWAAAVAARYRMHPLKALCLMLAVAVAVGVVWERWEYVTGLTSGEFGYWHDTLKDLLDDMVGAAAAGLLYTLSYKKR